MKNLQDLSNEELWQLFPIILSEHQDCWRDRYLSEKDILIEAIGKDNIVRMNHIGSTAVSGLLAKPTIDILIEIKDKTNLDALISNIEFAEYIYSPQPENPPPHMMFLKGYTPEGFKGQAFHVHIRYIGDWNELYFRDYLKKYPAKAKEYGELKLKMKERFEHDRDGYTESKTEFIKNITDLAKIEFRGKYILQ